MAARPAMRCGALIRTPRACTARTQILRADASDWLPSWLVRSYNGILSSGREGPLAAQTYVVPGARRAGAGGSLTFPRCPAQHSHVQLRRRRGGVRADPPPGWASSRGAEAHGAHVSGARLGVRRSSRGRAGGGDGARRMHARACAAGARVVGSRGRVYAVEPRGLRARGCRGGAARGRRRGHYKMCVVAHARGRFSRLACV